MTFMKALGSIRCMALKADNLHALDTLLLKNVNPHIIFVRMLDNINKHAPVFAEILKEGIKDGSITTEYPNECAEIFLLLVNTWCDPSVFECDITTLKRRYTFVSQMMKKMGADFLSDELLNDYIKYMESIYLDKK